MDTLQFPPEFQNAAVGMGAPKRYFPARNFQRVGSLVLGLVLLGGAILVFLDGAYLAYLSYQKHGLVTIDEPITGTALIVVLLLILAGLFLRSAYRKWIKGVLVYERGFAVRDRKGIQAWHWEDLLSITCAVTRHYTNGVYTGTSHVYKLVNLQRQTLVLNDLYVKVDELAKEIQDAAYPILYSLAAGQYNSGQKLTFGPVEISRDGLQVGKKVYPWAEIDQISIKQGILKVSKKGGAWLSGASASAAVIPNLNVLLSLIYQVVGVKAG